MDIANKDTGIILIETALIIIPGGATLLTKFANKTPTTPSSPSTSTSKVVN
jgi:hypothetical protein